MTARKLAILFLILAAIFYSILLHELFAERLTPRDIEVAVLSIAGGQNITAPDFGSQLEEENNIHFAKDGKWNCRDRAEIGKRLAEQNGYKAVMRWNGTHMWTCIYDDAGVKHDILQVKSGKQWVREVLDRKYNKRGGYP